MRVMVIGTFDILHYGHLALLKFCKELAGKDEFIVGLNSSNFVIEYKGQFPIMNYESAAKRECGSDYVRE
jgi:glycerol-3-phosphate cytidylyltransferase